MRLLTLSQTDVRRALPMAETLDVVAEAFRQFSAGSARFPVRTQLPIESRDAVTLLMPAYLAASDQLGMKLVTVFPRNVDRDLPTIHAIVALLDPETGVPLALLDGTYLTALRTGAASGAATRILARPESSSVAICGAGTQGRTQLEAVAVARPVSTVRVFDAREEATESFVREMASHPALADASVESVSSAAEAVCGADVICTATTSTTPVFADADLKPGVHINAIGSFTPEMQEIPSQTVVRARVVVDSREACWHETGDLLIPQSEGRINRDHVDSELGELVPKGYARREDDEVTLFKAVGLAVQDVSVAALAVARAREMGIGTWVEL